MDRVVDEAYVKICHQGACAEMRYHGAQEDGHALQADRSQAAMGSLHCLWPIHAAPEDLKAHLYLCPQSVISSTSCQLRAVPQPMPVPVAGPRCA